MKILVLVLALFCATSSFAQYDDEDPTGIKCVQMGQRGLDKLQNKMIMKGKGQTEINDVIRARMLACLNKCIFVPNLTFCIADVKE